MFTRFIIVPGGSSGAGGTPGEGYEGTVGGYLQQHQTHLTLQQHNQLQQLQQLHHYQQQQLLQYQQQQQVSSAETGLLCSVLLITMALTTLSEQFDQERQQHVTRSRILVLHTHTTEVWVQ